MWLLWLFWTEIVYRPIFNILILFLDLFQGSMWWAIIALTLLVRWLMRKNSAASNQMQSQMGDLQPKMQKIQEKYKDDPTKMQSEMMKLMKDKWAGPLKWCLTMLIQLPVFLWLFYVIRDYSQNNIPDRVYSFFESFGTYFTQLTNVDTTFFGMDLLQSGNLILAIVVAILMFAQMQMTMKSQPQKAPQMLPNGQQAPDMSKMMGMMWYFMAFMMWSFAYSVASWVGLYLLVTTLFGLVQFVYQRKELLMAQWNAKFRNHDEPEVIE